MLSILISCTSFAQNTYKISSYEVVPRFNVNDQSKIIPTYEITNLFVKVDSIWIENENYLKKDSFYMVTNGVKGSKIRCYYKTDTVYHFSRREVYYIPKPVTKIKGDMGKTMLSEDGPIFSKACFLTNNTSFTRKVSLKKYTPGYDDIKLIKDNFFPYIKKQFSKFCGKNKFDEMNQVPDSSYLPVLDTAKIEIDERNTFIDSKNNKLITVIVPYALVFRGIYPFNGECFREDMAYEGLRITCYINSKGDLNFLGDELDYLEHGDFDNDGKDEFLFWYHIHNHDGYVLFYNDFKQTEEFKWMYH